MKNTLIAILLLLLPGFLFSQKNPSWNYYFGSDRAETRLKLDQYLNFYHYKALFNQSDSTIELVISHDSESWTIYSIFYFNNQGKCYALSNRRCDSIGPHRLQKFLKNKNYKWNKIGENKYLSRFSKCETLEVIEKDNCITKKRTKLDLSKKEYKAILKKANRKSSG